MTDRGHEERERAREALRHLSLPNADPDFRDRLGHNFAVGAFPPDAKPRRRRGVARLAVAAVALVMLVFAVARLFSPPVPDWRLAKPEDASLLEVDGVPFTELAPKSTGLRPGTRVRAREADADLVIPGMALLQLTAGTELTLPGLSERGGGDPALLVSGEMRFTSGLRFSGRRLRVRTPEAQVEVTGTTVAVIRDSAATCVCVFAGSARMGAIREPLAPVLAGTRRSIYRDGRPPFTEPIRDMEQMKLGMLRDRGVELLGMERP